MRKLLCSEQVSRDIKRSVSFSINMMCGKTSITIRVLKPRFLVTKSSQYECNVFASVLSYIIIIELCSVRNSHPILSCSAFRWRVLFTFSQFHFEAYFLFSFVLSLSLHSFLPHFPPLIFFLSFSLPFRVLVCYKVFVINGICRVQVLLCDCVYAYNNIIVFLLSFSVQVELSMPVGCYRFTRKLMQICVDSIDLRCIAYIDI